MIADQISRQQIMLVSSILRAGSIFLLTLIPENVWLIVGVSFLTNSIFQFFIPALSATIPRVVKRQDLLMANSIFTLSMYASMVTGFVFAGPIAHLFGFKPVFVLASLLTASSSYFIYRLGPSTTIDHKNQRFHPIDWLKAGVDQVGEGIRFVLGNKIVQTAFFVAVGLNGLIGLISSLGPGFVVDVLQISSTSASYVLMAPFGVGMVAGGVLVGKFGNLFSKQRLIGWGMIIGGFIFFLLGFFPVLSTLSVYNVVVTNTYLALPAEHIVSLSGIVSTLAFFLGFVAVLVVIPNQTALQEHTPDKVRGRVFGVFGVLVYGASSIPTLVGGPLADLFGVTTIIMMLGVAISVLGIVFLKR